MKSRKEMGCTPNPNGLVLRQSDGSKDFVSWGYVIQAINAYDKNQEIKRELIALVKEVLYLKPTKSMQAVWDSNAKQTLAKAEGK